METTAISIQSTVTPADPASNFNDWAEEVLKGCVGKSQELIAMDQERINDQKRLD